MKSVLDWIAICLFGAFFAVNGLLMVVSPKTWFRLPKWIGVHGSLAKDKYSSGPASIEVRILGAIFVGFVGWVIYDSLFRQ
jgi:hypothetical protein